VGKAPIPKAKRCSRIRSEAFLRAARTGDLEGLLAILDPDAVLRIDAAARIDAPPAEAGMARELRGASTWATQFIAMSRGLRFVEPALIDGSVGVILAPGGKLSKVLTFTVTNATVTRIEVIGDPARLRELDIALLSARVQAAPALIHVPAKDADYVVERRESSADPLCGPGSSPGLGSSARPDEPALAITTSASHPGNPFNRRPAAIERRPTCCAGSRAPDRARASACRAR
jgi:hypothetical protein